MLVRRYEWVPPTFLPIHCRELFGTWRKLRPLSPCILTFLPNACNRLQIQVLSGVLGLTKLPTHLFTLRLFTASQIRGQYRETMRLRLPLSPDRPEHFIEARDWRRKGEVVAAPWRRMGECMYRPTFSWALAGSEWSASSSCRFTPGERAPCTLWMGGWVGPSFARDDVEKWKFFTLPRLELRPLDRPACNQSLSPPFGFPCDEQKCFVTRRSCPQFCQYTSH
jgi:hypothetical protein